MTKYTNSINQIKHFNISRIIVITILLIAAGLFSRSASASHSWNNYHWARQSNPFTLKLGSNVSSTWSPYLATTASDWTQSDVLDTAVVPSYKNPKTCRPTSGRVEVCSARYGYNGWLGLAQIWINGSHIVQGTTKVNDTYFQLAAYNTPEEKNHVMCQEVGHTLGLNHQDESGASLGTCMDYSSDPSSQHPNLHDYEELGIIYAHLDTTTTVSPFTASSAANQDQSDLNKSGNWGRRVYRSQTGHQSAYEKRYNDGSKLITIVTEAN